MSNVAAQVLKAAGELRDVARKLHFAAPVECVYNPLE
jgi:hypothetical protein